jgi:hypothetical protein
MRLNPFAQQTLDRRQFRAGVAFLVDGMCRSNSRECICNRLEALILGWAGAARARAAAKV